MINKRTAKDAKNTKEEKLLRSMTTLTATDLMEMSQAELDDLYQKSPAGEIPEGFGKGIAIFAAGAWWGKIPSAIAEWIFWQGNHFYRDRNFLLNKISPFRFNSIKADIYRGDSQLCPGESIILDYSQTSIIFQKIRDEIREVAPGVYLGNAFWGSTRVLSFILEF